MHKDRETARKYERRKKAMNDEWRASLTEEQRSLIRMSEKIERAAVREQNPQKLARIKRKGRLILNRLHLLAIQSIEEERRLTGERTSHGDAAGGGNEDTTTYKFHLRGMF